MISTKLNTGKQQGIRVALQVTGCQASAFGRRVMNPDMDPFRNAPGRGYRNRHRLAILSRQAILSRWPLAEGVAGLQATHCPGTLTGAKSQTPRKGPGERPHGRLTTEPTAI